MVARLRGKRDVIYNGRQLKVEERRGHEMHTTGSRVARMHLLLGLVISSGAWRSRSEVQGAL